MTDLKMADKMLLLFYISLISVTSGDQLTPFIAWSNNKILSSVQHTTDIDNIINTVSSSNIKMVILFGCEDFSFDDIVKFGGVFDDQSVNSFTNLKNSLDLAPYQYWTGLKLYSRNWISSLASGLGLSLKYLDSKDIISEDGLYVISSEKCTDEDVIISEVMKKLEESSYLAIFTQFNRIIEKRSLRNTVSIREGFSVTGSNDTSNCPIGGILRNTTNNSSKSSHPCLLFCLKQNFIFYPQSTRTESNCTLKEPSNIQWCCEYHITNNIDFFECQGEEYPYVQLNYIFDDGNNTCYRNDISRVSLKFIFPKNVSNNLISLDENEWAIIINASYSNNSLYSPPDDDIDEDGEYRSILVQRSPNNKLYQRFSIGTQFSYACAVEEYNTYNYSLKLNGNETYESGKFGVILRGIHVQPYNININVDTSSFSVTYNCIGYFTHVTWMGIFSVLVLLLILYVSILCAFSMKTIDQFEDPRGQTISVEKLH